MRQEIRQFDLLRFVPFEMRENDLQAALKELDLAAHQEEIAGLETTELRVGRVPQAGVDDARAVAQIHLNVKIAVAIGPQLLIRNQVDFCQYFPVREVLHETPAHSSSILLDRQRVAGTVQTP